MIRKTQLGVKLTQMLMMNLTDLNHLNALMQFLQWIQNDCHHSIKIVFYEKNWILSDLHNNANIKHHVVCYYHSYFAKVIQSKNTHMWKMKYQFLNLWSIVFFSKI